jgi:hypothetical protein
VTVVEEKVRIATLQQPLDRIVCPGVSYLEAATGGRNRPRSRLSHPRQPSAAFNEIYPPTGASWQPSHVQVQAPDNKVDMAMAAIAKIMKELGRSRESPKQLSDRR